MTINFTPPTPEEIHAYQLGFQAGNIEALRKDQILRDLADRLAIAEQENETLRTAQKQTHY